MANDVRAKEEPESTETQEEATPTSEQKTSGETPDKPEGEATPEGTEGEESDALGLPGEASERTRKRVEEVLAENKALKQQLGQRDERESIFDSLNAPNVPSYRAPKPEDYIDPQTGVVNIEKFNKAITDAQTRASRAETAVQRYEDERQEREAVEKFPDLASDQTFRRLTRSVILDSMVRPEEYGGRILKAVEAAGIIAKQQAKAKKEVDKESAEAEGRKEAATVEGTSSGTRKAVLGGDLDDLRKISRGGSGITDDQKVSAIMARLRNIPPANAEKK
jgi:hypothetical protein